jgi:hypothetical protein
VDGDLHKLVVILLSFNEEIVLLNLSCAVGLGGARSDIFFRFSYSSSVFCRSLIDLVSTVFLFPCLRFGFALAFPAQSIVLRARPGSSSPKILP